MSTIYDLIIIGAGPGGYVAAERAGEMGKKVLIIEKAELGGICTNWGCIPTKSLLNSAKHFVHAVESAKYGVHCGEVRFDLKEAMAWKQEVVETLRSGIAFLMKKNDVDVVFGEASVEDRTHVSVGETTYEGKNLMIATGSSPFIPPIPGADKPIVKTSRDMLVLEEVPKELVVIGGGVIGMEFSSVFSSLGTKVTVIEMLDEILPMADAEFAKLMRREMKKVTCKTSCKVEEILDDGVIYTDKKGERQTISADMVLLSVGRRPNVKGFEDLGLDIGRTGIVVNDTMQTNLPGVYAVGDVNGRSLLAHSASRMGEVAVSHMFGKPQTMRYHAIPWAIYTNPEAAGCGLTEQEAVKKGHRVITASAQMRSNGRFLAEYGKRAGGLCKVVADADTKVILGIHLLGAVSSEMIHSAAVIIESELRVQDVREIVFPHPSVSEIIKDVCFQL